MAIYLSLLGFRRGILVLALDEKTIKMCGVEIEQIFS
jgi:hypothetical protein